MAPMVSICIVLYSTRFHWEDTGALSLSASVWYTCYAV
jgi:hypothetical protein